MYGAPHPTSLSQNLTKDSFKHRNEIRLSFDLDQTQILTLMIMEALELKVPRRSIVVANSNRVILPPSTKKNDGTADELRRSPPERTKKAMAI
jgi:hypothetical protein